MGLNIKKALKKAIKKPTTSLMKAATLGLANKQIDKLTNKVWKNSSLRDLYMKNQHAINNTAGMLALGATPVGGMMLGAGISPLMAVGGSAAVGAMQDKKDKAIADLKAKQAQEQAAKDAASVRLDETLGDIVGDPNSPVTGIPGTPQMGNPAFVGEPSIDPVTGELIDQVVGGTPVYGGAVDTGGQASKDQTDLLNEAELAMKLQQEQAGKSKSEREQLLKEYSDLIMQQQNRLLDENNPLLMEDLNRRGLLYSSELGNAMGRERAKAAQILQEQVGLQGLTDRDAYIKAMEDANTNYIQGRSGAIQRRYSLEDFARQAKVAKDTGIALQPISTGTPSSKAGDAAMVSAGANVATALKGK